MPVTIRTAALYDIHGNLPALEAAAAELQAAGVERLVIGGDVLPGPMPRECLDLLVTIDIETSFIRGNGESAVLAEREGRDCGLGPYRPMLQWVASQLTEAHVALIAQWPATVRLGEVLFCHATPRDENEVVNAATPDSTMAAIFEAAGTPVVVCGHTHVPYDRRVGDVRVVNAGSVGMPFQGSGAYWLLLDDDVRARRTDYDLESAARRIRATACPGADGFAATVCVVARGQGGTSAP